MPTGPGWYVRRLQTHRPGRSRRHPRQQALLGLFCAWGPAAAGIVAAILVVPAAPAAGQGRAARVPVVSVTAGKPGELAFTLSKSSGLAFPAKAPSTTITFRVANKGKLVHEFEVCKLPVETAILNACRGTGTKPLAPGQSAILTITFGRRGRYEYLSRIAGQAANGMKGLIGVGVGLGEAATPATTGPATTTPATTTTYTPGTTLTGAAAAGAAVWAAGGCIDCHSVSEVETQSGGNITLSLNQTHPGGPFPNGPLNATQMQQLAVFLAN